MKRACLPLSLVLLCVCAGLAANASGVNEIEKRVYVTRKIEGPAPVLDGRLDDAAWELVEWAGDFTQRSPYEGDDPSQETEFKILYDDHSVYVAYRAYDTEPGEIECRKARRDHFPGDWVEINIDSRHDLHTAFSFTASVSGVRGDEYISQDGSNWDTSWDPVWHSRTAIDERGWTAEVEIPLSQLRYSDEEDQVWGIQVMRRLFRKEERSTWQIIPEDASGYVSQYGELHGIRGIKGQGQIELMPYFVAQGERFQKIEGDPFADGRDGHLDLGLDGKIGLTGNIVADFTVNPDFGQVEADPAEVNLSAFETRFSERRPFFLEGSDLLNFRLSQAMTGGPVTMDNLFYSRRIGRAPQGDPGEEYWESVDVPTSTTILGAAKISGRTSRGLSIAILESVTANEEAEIDNEGERRKVVVEPMTNYFVGRLRQDFREGATKVGAMLTAVNRDIADPSVEFLHRSAYAGGFDLEHRWYDRIYYVRAKALMSHIRGEEEALLATQTSSAHYFQRPSAGHVDLDTTRTSLSGHAGSFRLGRSSGGRIRFETGVGWRSPGFETNDLGFLRLADEINQSTWLGYHVNDPFSVFHRFSVNTNHWMNWDFDGLHLWDSYNINTHMTFRNEWSLYAGTTRTPEYVANDELRGGPASKWPGSWDTSANFHTDHRRMIVVGAGGWANFGDNDTYFSRGAWADITYRPTNAMRLCLNPSLSRRESDNQFVDAIDEAYGGEPRYIFAKIDQKMADLTLRLDYCVTPNLTIQYYGQPFVASGKYSQFKRVTDPMADRYEDRFHSFTPETEPGAEIFYDEDDNVYRIDENLDGISDYKFDNGNFNYREFNSNLVVRWEYRPGSVLYLVWSQGRVGYTSSGEFDFRDDVDDLFDVHPHNIFLIKVSRWFSW